MSTLCMRGSVCMGQFKIEIFKGATLCTLLGPCLYSRTLLEFLYMIYTLSYAIFLYNYSAHPVLNRPFFTPVSFRPPC